MSNHNETILKEILEQSLAGYWDWNMVTGDEYLSPSFKKMFGYEDHELPNNPESWQKLLFHEDLFIVQETLQKHIASHGQIPYYNEIRYHHKNGSTVWVICTGKVLEWDNSGNALRMVGCHIDITVRKKLEESLLESQNLLARSQQIARLGSWKLDIKTNKLTWSDEVYRIFGLQPQEFTATYQAFLDFVHPEDRDAVNSAYSRSIAEKQDTYEIDHRIIQKNTGLIRYVQERCLHERDNTGAIVYSIGMVQDITEQKLSEEALNKAQKLESLGILAGGIAHDFNNLLSGIYGYIDIAVGTTTDPENSESLMKAASTIDRARRLTQQLLTFAKGGAPIKRLHRIAPFVSETAKFALSGSNVLSQISIPEELWMCEFDKSQMIQVIDNIIINAQQSMAAGGIIDIYAENFTTTANTHPTIKSGNYVKISIKDHGIGIPKEIIPKIFDPFFTTKSKGRGLGLSTCYSIINRHGGFIEIESEVNKGSTFHLYLPAAPSTQPGQSDKKSGSHQGNGLFIVMDDEEIMRDTVGQMLKSFGYSVVTLGNGKETIEYFLKAYNNNNQIAGLVLDLTIPGGIGGREVIQEIRKISLKVPVFVASGYADDPVMSSPADFGFTASICKPFKKIEFAKTLDKYI
jgi:PAS domain S-box-containing protein